jgi:hypothetical protein
VIAKTELVEIRQIQIDDCSRFISPKSESDAETINGKIADHNAALAKHREMLGSAQRGEVAVDIYELREQLDREECDLTASNFALVTSRRSLRLQLRDEFIPHRKQRQLELDEARARATAEAEHVWPPSDVPNQYVKRAEMVEQLCRKEIADVRWEPSSLHGAFTLQDDNDLRDAKRFLCQMFATI